ncbi:hypothetical protein A5644_02380 [Mycobacterium intracellulare subsp. yongonense]|nr:hypothetical protein A5644_02380 [Mycobacterium intracellulare subsp. yongonense]
MTPKIVAKAEIHSDKAIFGTDLGSREKKRGVAGHLNAQTDVGQKFSASRTSHRHSMEFGKYRCPPFQLAFARAALASAEYRIFNANTNRVASVLFRQRQPSIDQQPPLAPSDERAAAHDLSAAS